MSGGGKETVLVTGGAGFIGCNLADRLVQEGHRVRIYDALSRPGVEDNLAWLTERHGSRIEPVVADVRDADRLSQAVRGISAVFHLAAQVAVTTSMVDPRADFETNVLGTFNLLEAVRGQADAVPVIFASTNKVYGDLAAYGWRLTEGGYAPADPALSRRGIGEKTPLDFHSPYGCSKGAADQYVLDYARSYDLPTVVLRMSCIYGRRQMGTEDQGWVAHFLINALQDEPITIYGDGHQVRDILHIDDAVDAYVAAWRRSRRIAGRAFNIGGGPANAVSLRMLLDHIAKLTGRAVKIRHADWRPGDQRWFVADTSAAERELGAIARQEWRGGVERLACWLAEHRKIALPQALNARMAVAS